MEGPVARKGEKYTKESILCFDSLGGQVLRRTAFLGTSLAYKDIFLILRNGACGRTNGGRVGNA